jgi:hypothetical protein
VLGDFANRSGVVSGAVVILRLDGHRLLVRNWELVE